MRVDRCNVGGIPDVFINNNVTYLNNKPQKRKRAKKMALFFSCPILNAGRGKSNAHKPQNTIQTNKRNNTRNQTRTPKTDTERENTNGKRKQPKTAQILRFGHYLKKEYQTQPENVAKLTQSGRVAGVSGAGVCVVSCRAKIMQ